MSKIVFVENKKAKKPWHVRLFAKNGKLIWLSPNYYNRKDCVDTIEIVKESLANPDYEYETKE